MKSTMLRNPLKKLLCVGCVKVCLPVCPVKQGQGHIWNNPVRCQVWKVSSPTSDHSRKYKYYKICKPLPPHIHMCGHLSVCAVCVLCACYPGWRLSDETARCGGADYFPLTAGVSGSLLLLSLSPREPGFAHRHLVSQCCLCYCFVMCM